MALVWCRLSLAPGHQPELCTIKPGTDPSEGQAKRAVPLPSLAVFLLYAPHFFRYHEENSLAVYAHIFRFCRSTYIKDASYNEAFRISADDINETKILEMFSSLSLEDADWVEFVPPSFEGSILTMPSNHGCRVPKSEELTAILMLPDIHSLGLPSYQNELKKDQGRVTREVVIHETWVPSSIVNERSCPQKYSGPGYFTANALKRYSSEGTPQLWCAPRTIVRAPWRDAIVPSNSNAQLQTPCQTPSPSRARTIKQESRQTQPPSQDTIPTESVVEFAKRLVEQFRVAQQNGFITPNVRLGDNGLTWDGMEDKIRFTKRVHPDLSIDRMVAADKAVQANLLSEQDKRLLYRILEDLEGDSGVPRCLRPFEHAIDPFEEDPTKSSIAGIIQDMSLPLEIAMKQMTEYANDQHDVEDAFVKKIMKPCCLLMDIDYPGTPGEAHRAITQADLDVGMALKAEKCRLRIVIGLIGNALRHLMSRKLKSQHGRARIGTSLNFDANLDHLSRRKCDGYTSPPKGTYSWDELLQGNISDVALGQSALTNAAPALGGSLNKHFWITIVPQVANQEPVAKHAMMAVSSLYETFTKRSRLDIACGADDQSSAFAVWHYNEAIRLLRTTTDRALILRIMELEHHVNLDDMKLDDDDDISEIGEGDPALVQKERIVNFSANFANTEFPRRNVRFNFLLKEGQSKEYVVEDDWISVKSRPKTQLLEEESEWTWKGHC
ncbi:Aspercryptin biosynthesis cluster-specific transcription regulator atnN [Colletotrichum sp. SAR 10_96]|nr:Aspercryptin biosynthesis cluster-specific transcription regulator atnN [Colletotrichum sp. SAR 10_96]